MAVVVLAPSMPSDSVLSAQQLNDTVSGRQPRFLLAASPRPIPLDVARTPVLARSISLTLDGMTLKEALRKLSEQSGLLLTYSDDVLPRKGHVHLRAEDITVAAALTNVLLDAGVDVVFSANGRAVLVARQKRAALAGTITGHVIDNHGDPVQGAMVDIQGTQLGSVTGADGLYRIQRIPPGPVAVTARRLGYRPSTKTATVPDGGTVQLDFTLEISATNLGAVVVTGTTGNQLKSAQGALVAQVDATEVVSKTAAPTVSDILTARVPGITATLGSGTIGQATRFFIRGGTSVALSNEPIVFIDGVRMYSDLRLPPGGSGGQSTSALNDLNPDDIKSIEIVKGPAASTLYGADASAGVIQIITKKGAVGAKHATQSLSLEYDNNSPNFTPATNYSVCPAALTGPTSPTICRDHQPGDIVSDNYLDRVGAFKDGHLGTLNYSIQGGGERYGYFISGRADNQTGTNINTYQTRRMGRGNFTLVSSPKLSFDANISVQRTDLKLPQTDQSTYSYLLPAALFPPIAVPLNADGTRGLGSLTSIGASYSTLNEINTLRTTPSLTANYTPLVWFKNRLTLGGDLSSVQGNTYYPRNNNGWYPSPTTGSNLGFSNVSKDQYNIYTVDYAGTIKTSFLGNENITSNLSFGTQYINDFDNALSGSGQGFITNTSNLLNSAAQISSLGQTYAQQKSFGYYVVEQLGFHDQLYVEGGGRVDRYSSFGASNPTIVLPKVSISYTPSKSSMWQRFASFIPELHLRAAYGTTGRAPAPGTALQTYSSINFINANGTVSPGVVPGRIGNPDLKPETGREFEAGFDAGFFGGRAGVEVTYFDKISDDLLFNIPLPPSLGFGVNGPLTNVGKNRNNGVEFSVNAMPFDHQNFRWEATVTGATLNSKVVSLGVASPIINNGRTVRVGLPIGGYWAQKVTGVDVANNVATVTDTAVYLGSPIPDFQGTLSTTFTLFRNIRLYTLFETKQGFKTYNLAQQFRDRSIPYSAQVVLPPDQGGYTAAQRLYYLGNSSAQYVTESGVVLSNQGVLGPYIQDADFVRWRELSATVSLPTQWAQSLHAAAASLTLGGRNLHLWTNYKGPDPESLGFGPGTGNATIPQYFNVDLFVTPPTRDFIARLNLTF